MDRCEVYFGSFASRGGTYVLGFDFNAGDGTLTPKLRIDGLYNPSYTNFDRTGGIFFSVDKDRGTGAGFVRSYLAGNGGLTQAGRFSTGGSDPCYVMADRTNTYVAAANYSSGSFRIWKFDKNGQLTPYGRPKKHRGSSIDPRRQTHPYCHSTVWSPWQDVLYVCDLGTDRVVCYRNNAEKGAFEKAGQVSVAPGSGPRHLCFNPNMRMAYLMNEIGNTVTVFKVLQSGALEEVQTLPTLPADFTGKNTTADIHASPDGRYLYASNRGHDTLAIYKLDEKGLATFSEYAPVLGNTPRGFDISPDGDWLICANQDSANVIVFRRDKDTGGLAPVHELKDVAGLVNVRFRPRPSIE